ncbi:MULTISPECIES: tryptophan synthase subunit alpha [Asticcacaulis]|uniref:tryptophan synthase subunit alpha n=1 Tax=Asticcacaulis TaxID=76890 RepID=UPI001AE33AE0|nr:MULTISPECIES: tryptophan synthase subunit alpha [Asticcacaulis]MBP2159845.1 tryptophan synthase alpha chain [Asticcacaulis solisilvae]MDR6800890.1 tryptophan synthase alpha chain [Asticcacaulis sp. BE141]
MPVSRIDTRFADLKAQNKGAFVAYIMAGDPDLETSFELLKGLPAAGADLIELGFPFSDPMAEGPTIQRAAERSLKNGTKIKDVFELVRRFREIDQDTPIILMGYMNPVESRGYANWAASMREVGADGLIVVDCPPEEADGLTDALDTEDLALIRLATPTSDDNRLQTLVRRTRGFIYYVSVAGVTGVKEADANAIAAPVSRVREAGGLPVAVGFGIRTPERAAEVARVADAAVVGSALVEEIKNSLPQLTDVKTKVLEKAANLAHAVHTAR